MSQLLKLRAGECLHQMLGHTTLCRDIRQVDLCAGSRRQLDLCLLGSLFQTLHGHRVFAQVDALVALEAIGQPLDDHLIEIVATEMGVTIGREHLEHATAKLKDGDIKRTATEVEHGDFHILIGLVYTVGECGSRRLVHDTLHVKSGNLAGLLGGLTL